MGTLGVELILPGKAASLLVERGLFLQLECAETKFLPGIRRRRRLDERKRRIRELLPDSKVLRRNREPTECEHVSARFGHVSRFLPSDLIDHRSFFPSQGCNRITRPSGGSRLGAGREQFSVLSDVEGGKLQTHFEGGKLQSERRQRQPQ
jgi:hypothetical protein